MILRTASKNRLLRIWEFLRTTAIGGVLFLLPIAGLVFILSYVFQLVLVVYKAINAWLPFHSAIGIALLFVVAMALVILACFVTGLLASRSIAKQGAAWLESNLLKVFPKYAVYKDILTGTLGGTEAFPTLKPIRVQFQGITRIAFESNRIDEGQTVVVYFPGSPDPWSGFVGHVPVDQVSPLDISFSDAVSDLEQMGRPKRLHVPADRTTHPS